MIRFTEPGYTRKMVLQARAHEARGQAVRWSRSGLPGAADMAAEWQTRAELAERYAERAAEVQS